MFLSLVLTSLGVCPFVPVLPDQQRCTSAIELLDCCLSCALGQLRVQCVSGNNVFPATLTSDVAPIAIMTMFALTNGLITSLAMMRAPRLGQAMPHA